ncbi:MAG: sulfite oxidase [Candidatus Kryptonium sp.]
MPFFIVQHKHEADNCPARNPELAQMLLKHLALAKDYKIEIRSEGVVDGSHRLFLFIESDERENVENFMKPFTQFGEVEILNASPCESVVERGGC